MRLFYLPRDNFKSYFEEFAALQHDPSRWSPMRALRDMPLIDFPIAGAYHTEFWRSRANLRLLAHLSETVIPAFVPPIYVLIMYGVGERAYHFGDIADDLTCHTEAIQAIRELT